MDEPPPPALQSLIAGLLIRSRYAVLLAVLAMVAIAIGLFALATVLAARDLVSAFDDLLRDDFDATEVKVGFLQVVTLVLKAVVFYLIGTGLFTLFIGPLPLPAAARIDSLTDLEVKIVGVIVVILATSFLERYQAKGDAGDSLLSAAALTVAVIGLGLFQLIIRRDDAATKLRR